MEENIKKTLERIVNNAIAQIQNDVYFEYPESRDVLYPFVSEWEKLGYKLIEKFLEEHTEYENN
mgnify:FL=1